MTVCKHCGTEIENGLEYCPNCGQELDETLGDFFEPVEELEEEAYNIFDAPDEFDMDELLSKEFDFGVQERKTASSAYESSEIEETDAFPMFEEVSEPEEFPLFEEVPEPEEFPSFEETSEPEAFPEADLFAGAEELSGMDFSPEEEPEAQNSGIEASDDLSQLFGLFGGEGDSAEIEEFTAPTSDGLDLPVADESDLLALDDLFQDLDNVDTLDINNDSQEPFEEGFEELLAASKAAEENPEGKSKKTKKKKEKRSFFQTVFGNVPIDPSKIKKEPTPEEVAAKKQKEEEAKKAKAEEKKLAEEEKKQIAQREKEEKARQKALAKEEKKAKKLQEAKLILEEMKDTRINRLGATIVFVFFAVVAIVLFFGGGIFGYSVGIHNATNYFNKAYGNNVKYYTDAYNEIYGLEIKPEDQVLSDKIMTVMFVNKQLNSYNSQMELGDYEAALHSLLLGLYRYGQYYDTAVPLGAGRDMDYVRTQILGALENTFGVSEDEAEVLRSMLTDAGAGGMHSGINADAARAYNLELYEIVKESGLEDDSNN